MKYALFSAAIILFAPLVAGSASATNYTTSVAPNYYMSTGSLSGNSQITFSYTSSNSANPYLLAIGDETVGNSEAQISELDPINGSPASGSSSANVGGNNGGILTVLAVAVINGVSQVTIQNLTSQAASFAASFSAPFLAANGTFSVSGPSAVTPLPGAALMFLTGLAGLVGFGMYKKQAKKI